MKIYLFIYIFNIFYSEIKEKNPIFETKYNLKQNKILIYKENIKQINFYSKYIK